MTDSSAPQGPTAAARGPEPAGVGGTDPVGRANQGRRVAARNRAALISAAREIFAEQGLEAPLSAVARRAEVGQGSLYRHFPDRMALANAVLDENVGQIERAAAEPGATLESVLGVVTWHVTRSTAFVELVRAYDGGECARLLAERVRRVLVCCLPTGYRLSADDVMLAIAMVSGAVTGPTLSDRERLALAAWRLLGVEVGPLRAVDSTVAG